MELLLAVAFISGLVTILAPCIWPLLPIIFSYSATGGKRKALGITLGIMGSFAFFTLAVSYLVSRLNFNPDFLRIFAVIVIGFLGLTMIVPLLNRVLESYVSRLSGKFGGVGNDPNKSGFKGGLTVGVALGIVWTPCAGPILATIATLAATQAVNFQIVLVTIVYVIGVGIPLFGFAALGSHIFNKSKLLNKYTGRIQQIFGVIMILTAIGIYTNYDKVLQARLLDALPAYTDFINHIENSGGVEEQLDKIRDRENDSTNRQPSNLSNLGTAADFEGIDNWLNVEKPIAINDLKGKVVLVDFWTYTCINCIRTLPYVTSWWDKYQDMGLVVVGVHTPEFEFEKSTKNVENALKQYDITYPVAQDNNYVTWDNYNNRYWPAKYLIDVDGKIRYTHFGEGKYEETEKVIIELLAESGVRTTGELVSIEGQDSPGLFSRRPTPEIYLGLQRIDRFASNETPVAGTGIYTLSNDPGKHFFGYEGEWVLDGESGESGIDSSLTINFLAKEVFLVITPKNNGDTINVFLDGEVISKNVEGDDVKGGKLELDVSRLYKIVKLDNEASDHVLRLEFENEGTRVFAFTFG